MVSHKIALAYLAAFVFVCATHSESQQWNSLKGPFDGAMREYAVSATNANICYAVGEDGIFKSTDSGDNWVKVFNGNHSQISISNVDNNIVVTDKSVSTDGRT